ncbi:NAD(P)-binding protein [soil metagenome]
MTRLFNIAVIGAGIAGLSCASALQAAGHTVQVFDKSRGAGGRMSTRRNPDEGWQCDHGAQYFTARDPAFAAEVVRWQQAGVAALWSPRIAVLNGPSYGATARQPGPLDRFVGTPRMTAPAQWLTGSLNISLGMTIQRLHREGPFWQLESAEQGLLETRFDAVLLALPAPQVGPIAESMAPALAAVAAAAQMRGCWALMLQFDAPVDLPLDAAFVNSGPLRWIARDSSKPGRNSSHETWLLHAEAEWSEAQLELPPAEAATLMLAAFVALGGPAPRAWTAHRWRYADTREPLLDGCIWDSHLRLGLCGDWLNGGKVEGAWLSGQRLAARLSSGPAATGT